MILADWTTKLPNVRHAYRSYVDGVFMGYKLWQFVFEFARSLVCYLKKATILLMTSPWRTIFSALTSGST